MNNAQKPELLAPAGGMAQLKAAVRYGADAVYGGLPRFGLRASGDLFTLESLQEALEFLHQNGKRFYLTLNILPYDDELDDLADTAYEPASNPIKSKTALPFSRGIVFSLDAALNTI